MTTSRKRTVEEAIGSVVDFIARESGMRQDADQDFEPIDSVAEAIVGRLSIAKIPGDSANRPRLKTKSFGQALKGYGLSYEQYLDMWVRQEGKCLTCLLPKVLVIDHCHDSGAVRGLLCNDCNTALGQARENTETLGRMILYLQRSHSVDTLERAHAEALLIEARFVKAGHSAKVAAVKDARKRQKEASDRAFAEHIQRKIAQIKASAVLEAQDAV